jgi:uncharacterized protein (TIGR03067 family)
MSHVLPLLAVLCLAFAPAPVPRHWCDAAGEIRKLQGTWVLEREDLDGKQTEEVPAKIEWLIEGESVRNLVRGQELYRTTFRVSAGHPMAFDLMERDGSVASRGIYALEGDKLTIAFALEGGSRPRDFRPAEGKVVRVYHRVKR